MAVLNNSTIRMKQMLKTSIAFSGFEWPLKRAYSIAGIPASNSIWKAVSLRANLNPSNEKISPSLSFLKYCLGILSFYLGNCSLQTLLFLLTASDSIPMQSKIE